MTYSTPIIDLGFVAAPVPAGSHICQIYSSDSERDDALVKFVTKGLLLREYAACFSDHMDRDVLSACLKDAGISFDEAQASGHLIASGAEAVYFEGNAFNPERLLARLKKLRADSIESGCVGARVIGEMSPRIGRIEGGSRLFEYEGLVNALLREQPLTAVCQYDARVFGGATIMDILSVHPLMVVRGSVIQNPFFIAPESLNLN